MNIDVKNTIKPIDYNKSIKILEKRVEDVLWVKRMNFYGLWSIIQCIRPAQVLKTKI